VVHNDGRAFVEEVLVTWRSVGELKVH
jgi:hypothetical protein